MIGPDILAATGEGVGPVPVPAFLSTGGIRSPLKERRASLLLSQTGSCHSGARSKNEGGPRIQRGCVGGWRLLPPALNCDLLFEPFCICEGLKVGTVFGSSMPSTVPDMW